ncbi:Dak1 domain-containing protein [Lipomyces oligophaga]|uniref:Dak1 domain-containing protein n=1 Tax=Lipomyces oligophaga TaxID=45792 RepID=UPI0034CD1417
MSTKHFVSDIDFLVLTALEELVLTNPEVIYYKDQKVVAQISENSKDVAVISGGGAGHEPAHAGFVGAGMLTAAVSGWIFASPSVAQISHAIGSANNGPAGVLLIIKNYTGDIFHFSLAAEKARSQGIPVEIVIVGDDVAVGRTKSGKVGRRGLAGTVLVHKIAGALSAEHKSLEEIAAIARETAANLVTIGVSLGHVHIPGRKIEKENLLGPDEVELGLGIHNERGFKRISPIPKHPEIVSTLIDQLVLQDDPERSFVDFADSEEIILLLNNLGGLSPLELGSITAEVVSQLTARGLRPSRLFRGTYMTSLDGPGFSITLLKTRTALLPFFDAPTNAVGFTPGTVLAGVEDVRSRIIENFRVPNMTAQVTGGLTVIADTSSFKRAVTNAAAKVIVAEPKITNFDTVVGDGDCGYTLKRAATAASDFVSNLSDKEDITVTTLAKLADAIEKNMDGTSGAIFGIFLHALATAVTSCKKKLDVNDWATAARDALEKLYLATPARVGDRTLMDALVPFVETLMLTKSSTEAAIAARKGAESTCGMNASLGRAVYVDASGYDIVPDPGAIGIAELVEGLTSFVVKD